MLVAAENKDWDGLVELEARRRPLIHACFDDRAAGAEGELLAAAIHEVLEIDGTIMALAAAGRSEAAEAIQGLARGKRARQAYGGSGT